MFKGNFSFGSECVDDEVFDIVLSIVLSTYPTIDRISMCRYSWLAVAKYFSPFYSRILSE